MAATKYRTIEQLLKPVISAGVQTLLDAFEYADPDNNVVSRTLVLGNDLKYKARTDAKTTIKGVLKTTIGTRSDVPGITAVSSGITLYFLVEANWVQDFLGVLNLYCAGTHNVVATVTDDIEDTGTSDITYSYVVQWQTPVVQSFDSEALNNEPVKTALVLLQGTLNYSQQLAYNDETISFQFLETVNGVPNTPVYYPLLGIVSQKKALNPSIGATALVNYLLPKYKVTAETEQYTFTVTRIPDNKVHDLLFALFHATRTTGSYDTTVKFVGAHESSTSTMTCKISGLSLDTTNGVQYITFALIRAA